MMRSQVERLPAPSFVVPAPAQDREATAPGRIALILDLTMNKLGSLEQWILQFCRQAAAGGDHVDVFCGSGNLPIVLEGLKQAGSRWHPLEELRRRPLAGARLLAGYHVIHLNFVAVRSPLALMAYLAHPARVLLVDHFSGPPGPPARRSLGVWLDRLCLLRVERVIAVSDYVAERNRRRFGSHRRVKRVYNGVDVTRFRPRPRECGGELRLIAAAQLIPDKGLDVLLEALALLERSDWCLRVVGGGPERERLEAQARSLGLAERVKFLGVRSDLDLLLPEADLLIHPARWQEAFGLVVAEAMACGLPVIATRVGGLPELVLDGVSGLLVEPEDPPALARAIGRLWRDPALRQSMGRNARRRAEERFDLRVCVRRHLDCCQAWGEPL